MGYRLVFKLLRFPFFLAFLRLDKLPVVQADAIDAGQDSSFFKRGLFIENLLEELFRFNVRKSNTEPYLRVVAEATDKELLDLKLNEIKAILMRFK